MKIYNKRFNDGLCLLNNVLLRLCNPVYLPSYWNIFLKMLNLYLFRYLLIYLVSKKESGTVSLSSKYEWIPTDNTDTFFKMVNQTFQEKSFYLFLILSLQFDSPALASITGNISKDVRGSCRVCHVRQA